MSEEKECCETKFLKEIEKHVGGEVKMYSLAVVEHNGKVHHSYFGNFFEVLGLTQFHLDKIYECKAHNLKNEHDNT